MRILIAHNRYQQRGGEDVVVENEAALLVKMGHDVERFIVDNDEITGLRRKVQTAFEVFDNPPITSAFDKKLAGFEPQIVHFHNFFPRLSPAALQKSLSRRIPTLHTLHNYRLLCAGATFFRDGKVCDKCINTRWGLPAVRYRCYRKSPVGSFLVAQVSANYRRIFNAYPRLLTLVALNEFARGEFIRGGFDPARIVVKGNAAPDAGLDENTRKGLIVFAGRLTYEKGFDLIPKIASKIDAEFEIIGTGPDKDKFAGRVPENVKFRGWLDHPAALACIKQAAVLAVPSRSYEGFPMVIAEAFSAGTPVLASRIGPLAELVEEGRSGLTFKVDDEAAWVEGIQQVLNNSALSHKLHKGARAAYEDKFSEQANGAKLISLYESAIARAGLKSYAA